MMPEPTANARHLVRNILTAHLRTCRPAPSPARTHGCKSNLQHVALSAVIHDLNHADNQWRACILAGSPNKPQAGAGLALLEVLYAVLAPFIPSFGLLTFNVRPAG